MKRVIKTIIIFIILFSFISIKAEKLNEYTITYDANGGHFDNNTKINSVNHNIYSYDTKFISHTENVDDTGLLLSDYGENWTRERIVGSNRGDTSKNHVITIPGAKSLTVELYANGEGCNSDMVCVWEGNHPDYDCETNEYIITEKGCGNSYNTYTLNGHSLDHMGYTKFTVKGDSVTFDFMSNDYTPTISNQGYGYYAIVTTDEVDNQIGEYMQPINGDLHFNGWYLDKEGTQRAVVDNITSTTTLYAKWSKNVEIVSGDFDTVGSLVKIGDEEFYVIGKTDDNHIKLFARYLLNLDKDNTRNIKQNKDSSDYIDFAQTSYWQDSSNVLLEKYEPRIISVDVSWYPQESFAFIYDDNSSIYPYVQKYTDYIESFGLEAEGTLISDSEGVELGCDRACLPCNYQFYICRKTYMNEFLFEVDHFWFGSGYQQGETNMKPIYAGYNYGSSDYITGFLGYNTPQAGVRPLIILDVTYPSDENEESKEETVKGEKEIKENPKTGVYGYTILTLIILVIMLIGYPRVFKQSYFK